MRKVTVKLTVEATLLVDEGVNLAEEGQFELITDNTAITVEDSAVTQIEVLDSR